MAISDAFVIGEDWISEHYFTTDATNESFLAEVIARRKEWDEEEGATTRSCFTEHRGDLERRLAALAEDPPETEVKELYADLLRILGYRTGEFDLETEGPLTRVSSPGLSGAAPLAVVAARPVETVEDLIAKDGTTLLETYEPEDEDPLTSVARLLSALFVTEEGPQFALVLAGRWLLVAERERWPEGRYLAVDLQLVTERNETKRGGEVDRALACVGARSLGPDADGSIWWSSVLEQSVRHTVGVSEDLREGVRRSVEIIANEVVDRRRAQHLVPLPADQAQPLAVQALRYLYRILFLLYAEASPELGVLPTGASEYDAGYSIDRLRELTLVDLHTQQSQTGTHLYESVDLLSSLVDRGHGPSGDEDLADGLEFSPLRADLFRPQATAHINEVKLGNEAVQQVLRHLLLSKEQKGRERGFISYVELGINQLGAVYEGLMSYTGFFAEEDLYEVAKHGDPSKGSWVVPVERADHLDEQDFVREEDPVTGEQRAVRHTKGSFVFRLAGRERQQSASYYTPEVLTRFTVQQALEELLDQDDQRTTAEEILDLTVCEPALGSGAFALEAVDQLARQYLTRRQDELDTRIDPDAYPGELQKVKAHIALHQVYGVDLNATAVELAEVSLWLSTMVRGLQAPWFGLRLRRGNSLVGARHAVYPAADVRNKAWLKSTPADVPLTDLVADMDAGTVGNAATAKVFHFLLPAEGWGSTVEVPKQVRDLVPDEVRALKSWRSSMRRKLTKQQVDRLVELSQRVEQLWSISLRRLRIAEAESSRSLDLWGRGETPQTAAVTREQIEESLADEDGAYRRLRRVMDAWCGLWFWPLTETEIDPPTIDEWVDALTMLLGRDTRAKKHRWMDTFQAVTDWEQLGEAEEQDRIYSGAERIEQVRETHPWLKVCEEIAARQGFFHWELDFATQFAHGGYDLQLGNPPWVRPDVDPDSLLAEGDPWWQLAHKPTEDEREAMLAVTLDRAGVRPMFVQAQADIIAVREFISDPHSYPLLKGLRADLYRCFMSQVWAHGKSAGVSSLIHPESHFTGERDGILRAECYLRLRRHWHFINELKLFDRDNHLDFGVHVYGSSSKISFLQAVNVYHPATIERSVSHDGSGSAPARRTDGGAWNVAPHRQRIQVIDEATLQLWAGLLGGEGAPALQTRMLYTSHVAGMRALRSVLKQGSVPGLLFSDGWNEKTDRERGRFRLDWAEVCWDEAIVQGPHIHSNTPLVKTPNPTLASNKDWSLVDFEGMAAEPKFATAYQRSCPEGEFSTAYTQWGEVDPSSARAYYRLGWRAMANNTAERTLLSAMLPPRSTHLYTIYSVALPKERYSELVMLAGVLGSLLADYSIRVVPKSAILLNAIERLAVPPSTHVLADDVLVRVLRLNCISKEYADLWATVWRDSFAQVRPVLTSPTEELSAEWSQRAPLRVALARRAAQIELDALVALLLGVSIDDLCDVYRTEFPVLVDKDHGRGLEKFFYDSIGRRVPGVVLKNWLRRGDRISVEERTAVHPGSGIAYTYELPFGTLDREADMRTAYAEFERRLAAREQL